MNILIVAPDSELSTHLELIAAVGGNTPTVLHGMVPTRQVLEHISLGKYDAIHFAGHGNRDALQMSDGTLDVDQLEEALAAATRNGKFISLVFLNSCKSIFSGAHIYSSSQGSPAFVVAWAHDVPDNQASAFAVRFWQSMGTHGNAHEAFDNALSALRREYSDVTPPLLLNGRMDDLRMSMREMANEISLLNKRPVAPPWMVAVVVAMSMAMVLAVFALFWSMFA